MKGYVQLSDGRVWQVETITFEKGATYIHFDVKGPYDMPYGGVGNAYLLYELFGQDGELVWAGAIHRAEFDELDADGYIPEGEVWDIDVSLSIDRGTTNNYRKATRWKAGASKSR
jgi:hypothetical protein